MIVTAHETITSRDGTPIAYESFGHGAPLIAVCGATCERALMRPTAEALGRHFTTINYDRRGRGDSGDTRPYAVEREVEDIVTKAASGHALSVRTWQSLVREQGLAERDAVQVMCRLVAAADEDVSLAPELRRQSPE